MQLSAVDFERLMESLVPPEPSRTEQRREQRLPVSAAAVIVPTAEMDAVLRVRVTDLSLQGICVLHRASMSLGSEFFLRIPQEGEGKATFVRCSVRSCKDAGDGMYRIGAEFCEIESHGPCMLSFNARDYD